MLLSQSAVFPPCQGPFYFHVYCYNKKCLVVLIYLLRWLRLKVIGELTNHVQLVLLVFFFFWLQIASLLVSLYSKCGIPSELIKLQGDWRSDAYMLYLIPPLADSMLSQLIKQHIQLQLIDVILSDLLQFLSL